MTKEYQRSGQLLMPAVVAGGTMHDAGLTGAVVVDTVGMPVFMLADEPSEGLEVPWDSKGDKSLSAGVVSKDTIVPVRTDYFSPSLRESECYG